MVAGEAGLCLIHFVTLATDPEELFPEDLLNYKHACLFLFLPDYSNDVKHLSLTKP